MKIRQITLGPESPFSGETVRFVPEINIIRGDNGIGKTAILEYASLLGHVACMEPDDSESEADVTINIVLSTIDRKFLRELASSRSDEAIVHFTSILRKADIELDELLEIPVPKLWFDLEFVFCRTSHEELKAVLAEESKLRDRIRVRGSLDHIRLVKALNLWSRPSLEMEGPRKCWSLTPRFVRASAAKVDDRSIMLSGAPAEPGRVFYFNTDMYALGTGLDIRESPKHLKENLAEVLLDRLQLVRCPRFRPGCSVRALYQVADSAGQFPKCQLFCDRVIGTAWGEIFSNQKYERGRVQWSRVPEHRDGWDFEWEFDLGRPCAEFVSSGQNQAFFLLAVLYGLATQGSCMLLDEPELHLSFSAGSRTLEMIHARTRDTRSQAIIVTHLPHLHRHNVRDLGPVWDQMWQNETEEGKDGKGQPEEADEWRGCIRMIYVCVGETSRLRVVNDVDAVKQAAASSYKDVLALAKGLRLPAAERVETLPGLRRLRLAVHGLRRGLRRFRPVSSGQGDPAP